MQTPEPLRIAGYEPALDGLRGFAVTAVVGFHACRDGEYFLSGGWIGVDVFFVLSGYLITNLLVREIKFSATIDLKKFYVRRILRLTPAFWAVLAFTIVAVLAFSSSRVENLERIMNLARTLF
ncbi:acyltransferase family protein [Methylobacterium sp. P31]